MLLSLVFIHQYYTEMSVSAWLFVFTLDFPSEASVFLSLILNPLSFFYNSFHTHWALILVVIKNKFSFKMSPHSQLSIHIIYSSPFICSGKLQFLKLCLHTVQVYKTLPYNLSFKTSACSPFQFIKFCLFTILVCLPIPAKNFSFYNSTTISAQFQFKELCLFTVVFS